MDRKANLAQILSELCGVHVRAGGGRGEALCFALSWDRIGLEEDFLSVAPFWEHRAQMRFNIVKGKL